MDLLMSTRRGLSPLSVMRAQSPGRWGDDETSGNGPLVATHLADVTHTSTRQHTGPVIDRLLTTAEAARSAIPARTLSSWRSWGRFAGPPFVRLGGHVRYRLYDLEAWVESRVQKAT